MVSLQEESFPVEEARRIVVLVNNPRCSLHPFSNMHITAFDLLGEEQPERATRHLVHRGLDDVEDPRRRDPRLAAPHDDRQHDQV